MLLLFFLSPGGVPAISREELGTSVGGSLAAPFPGAVDEDPVVSIVTLA